MLKFLLDTPFIIGVFVCILVGLSGCSNLPTEKEIPVIGTVSVPFASKAKTSPVDVINQQQLFEKLPVPSSGFINVQEGDTVFGLANRYDVPPFKIISENAVLLLKPVVGLNDLDKFVKFFSLSSTLSLVLGGQLKRKEFLSGRYADLLSYIVAGYAMEWHALQNNLEINHFVKIMGLNIHL